MNEWDGGPTTGPIAVAAHDSIGPGQGNRLSPSATQYTGKHNGKHSIDKFSSRRVGRETSAEEWGWTTRKTKFRI